MDNDARPNKEAVNAIAQQREADLGQLSRLINGQEADELGKVIMDLESSGEQH